MTFHLGTNLNMAQILVQNRVSMAQPILPDLVQRRGVAVKKKSPSVLMIVNLFATDDLSADREQGKEGQALPLSQQLRDHPAPR